MISQVNISTFDTESMYKIDSIKVSLKKKIIQVPNLNSLAGRFWPTGLMFDTPGV